MYLFEIEREWEGLREWERNLSRILKIGWGRSHDPEVIISAEPKSAMLNWLSHPGSPALKHS